MDPGNQRQTSAAKVVLAYIRQEDIRHWYAAFRLHGVRADLILREPEILARLSRDPPDLLLMDSRLHHLKSLAAATAICSENRLRSMGVHVIVGRQATAIHEQYWSAGAAACHDSEEDKSWTARQMLAGAAFIRRLLLTDHKPRAIDAENCVLAVVMRHLQENEFSLGGANLVRDRFGVEMAQLEWLVRKHHNKTLAAWIHGEKMGYAAYLLETTNSPIGEISMLLGYMSAANFSTAFRLFHGVTPRKYRKGKASSQ